MLQPRRLSDGANPRFDIGWNFAKPIAENVEQRTSASFEFTFDLAFDLAFYSAFFKDRLIRR